RPAGRRRHHLHRGAGGPQPAGRLRHGARDRHPAAGRELRPQLDDVGGGGVRLHPPGGAADARRGPGGGGRGVSRPLRLLLATGGTGGHIYPALAVAEVARAHGEAVSVIGQKGGMEERLVAEAGLPFHGVAAGRWNRSNPDPRQALQAVAGLYDAVRHVRRHAPDLVIGFGGFASFPGCVAAVVTGTPLVLQEGNAFPSRVNRWFAPRARLVISTYPGALERLRARRTEVIPFPIREQRMQREEARAALGLPQDAVVTLVMGGSQGSLMLNQVVPAAYEQLAATARPVVLHASGSRWQSDLEQRVTALGAYHVRGYVNATAAWSAADLAITRA